MTTTQTTQLRLVDSFLPQAWNGLTKMKMYSVRRLAAFFVVGTMGMTGLLPGPASAEGHRNFL
jgi:hypothetical protein